jgi:hypothetical protein
MRRLFSPGRIQLMIAISLANFALPVLQSEPRCPGSAASVTPRLIQRALIVIPVRINQYSTELARQEPPRQNPTGLCRLAAAGPEDWFPNAWPRFVCDAGEPWRCSQPARRWSATNRTFPTCIHQRF